MSKIENIDDLASVLVRKINLEQEAKEQNSDIQCPQCESHLPRRYPFYGWDNETGKASYYCTLCEYEF